MIRIYADFAYGPGPRSGCWWDETAPAPDWPALRGDARADVAIIGGGFTGVSAALHLAQAGADVALLEAGPPGWGASGRNGGFCCLGGARIDETILIRRFGTAATLEYRQAERDAVQLVARLIDTYGLAVDQHSRGETRLAHSLRAMQAMRQEAETLRAAGLNPDLTEARDLPGKGMAGPFHGALTIPVGFGLNPRKYLFGMAAAAARHGARLHGHTPAIGIQDGAVETPSGTLRAGCIIVATNGYSSENLPSGLASRYLPTQSNVLVTRPLSDRDIAAQGWHSDQAAYDSRGLLHYFRLMPDRRFLFGMRGGLTSAPGSEARARRRSRRHFEQMFPAWAHVESPYAWSGFVCLAANGTPFVGALPENPGVLAGLAYHGNGVAMGTYCGMLLARLALGKGQVPEVMAHPPGRFPLGRFRRLLVPPAYLMTALRDL